MTRFILLGLLLFSAGARAAQITDATGRAFDIPAPPARVLPAGMPAAVLLLALAPDLMMGWPHAPRPDALPLLPPLAAALPQLPAPGDEPGAAVRAAGAALVVDYGTVARRYADRARRITDASGVPALLLDGRLDQVPSVLRSLGAVLARGERAETLARLADAILTANPPRSGAGRAVIGRGADGLSLVRPGTGSAEVLERLGYTVAVPAGGETGGETGGAVRAATVEDIAVLDPDLLIQMDPGFRATYAATPGWHTLRAVRDGHAFAVPAEPFGWLDMPPSLNRLIGLAAFGSARSDPASFAALFGAAVYGRAPDAATVARWRDALAPLAP